MRAQDIFTADTGLAARSVFIHATKEGAYHGQPSNH